MSLLFFQFVSGKHSCIGIFIMASTPIKVTAAQENANGYLRDLHLVAVVGPDGSAIGGGGGGGGPVGPVDQGAPGSLAWPVSVGGTVDVAVTAPVSITGSVAVTGPLTNAQYTASIGAPGASSWPGTGNGTVIAILKAIHAQNEIIIAHLSNIEANTEPEPGPEP